ncbi:alpha/beta hydrolase family protein [Gracilimonas mengyeensis]|uniref:Xaa-Pro dipeptidyl-peptidase-like domain-containing protein n=1 Tax=Gracilimonas mengyeensis TaxID=1302730 RepID=A0A521FM04_9BACT|nr:alpha/beta hydrolase [Gracilimonas mengyeensis]SMO97156.1 hypothetical protein SAMN06265219_12315 [Gracilimonas mengyeensis]
MDDFLKRFFVFVVIQLFCFNLLIAQNANREEVVFKSGDRVLSGTLVLPESAENVPVLIFIGGINEWGDPFPQRQPFIEQNLERTFLDAGVGVFYYQPRGVGDSDGRWHRTTLPGFADDAIAAVRYLKQRREVNPQKIGLIGHGEDGWVAQIVAAEAPSEILFAASLAGPTFDAKRQLINEYHSEYMCAGEDSTTAYDKAVQKATSHQNWVSLFPYTKRWRHMSLKLDFEPASYIREINLPFLFVFAENDGKVYADWAEEELNNIFSGSIPSNFTVQSIPGANHFFHVASPCFEYDESTRESLERDFSFRFREVLRNWVFEQLQ